jgi:hypothetical protein
LREGFVRATGKRQLALTEPMPERRMHQILAENRHTPYETLDKLAQSEEPSIRRRVGRNAVTPEATVRALAKDRAWSVREGVAMNEAAPDDVLLTLARDRSVAVRRAVAANPGAQHEVVKALASDLMLRAWICGDSAVDLSSQPRPRPMNDSGLAVAVTGIDRQHGGPSWNSAWLYIETVQSYAYHASKALRLAVRISQLAEAKNHLTAAMESRTVIDLAAGAIMAQNRCSQESAMKILKIASSSRNLKLRDIAASVVASLS